MGLFIRLFEEWIKNEILKEVNNKNKEKILKPIIKPTKKKFKLNILHNIKFFYFNIVLKLIKNYLWIAI